jgi:hypothetical protein
MHWPNRDANAKQRRQHQPSTFGISLTGLWAAGLWTSMQHAESKHPVIITEVTSSK